MGFPFAGQMKNLSRLVDRWLKLKLPQSVVEETVKLCWSSQSANRTTQNEKDKRSIEPPGQEKQKQFTKVC